MKTTMRIPSHLSMEVHQVFLKITLILLLSQFVVTQKVPLSSGVERLALLDLRSSLGIRSRDWPIKGEPCLKWTGIECRNGRVIGINLSGLRRTRLGRLKPRFAVDSLRNFTMLVSFNASGFLLPGSMPDLFGSFSALQVLDLRSVRMNGSIPPLLGDLSRLKSLYLSGNNLIGSIPSGLGGLLELSILDLSRNSLTGLIPPDFALLGNLTRLDLSSNFLSGPIPPALGTLSGLQFLFLSDNSLSGSIPGQLGNLSQLVELDLSKTSLSGSLPVELRGLRNLKKMAIGNSGLQGPLQVDLFVNLTQLEVLVLNSNKLIGALPDALWTMPRLRFLDVSSNNFTGVLPSLSSIGITSGAMFNLSNNLFYGNLTSPFEKFNLIDLSSNYFQGNVSNDSRTNAMLKQNCLQAAPNQRSLEDCRLFYTSIGLNFNNFGDHETTVRSSSESDSKSHKQLMFILVGIFGGLGFIVLLVSAVALIKKTCQKGITGQRASANVGHIPQGGNSPIPKVPIGISGLGDFYTYKQMLDSTGHFSESNLIKRGHSGDIFRGILKGGISVIIKRVNLHSIDKELYLMELDFFSKASHTRLVPLLGHCLEHENEKLIVYKHMPNGDLSNSLYRVSSSEDDRLQSLDWITRLKIATGAAEGLSYLHHECSPPLVHRDIQASSILLDDKFEVRLGSFSEVCAQGGDSHQNVLKRLLQKPQSSSDQGPSGMSSSGPSSAICAYDVYCFGKVLLELITGKLGISKSDDDTTKEWLEHTVAYISMYNKELVTKIVDPSLIVDEDLLEEVWAVAIVARSCLNPKPSKRPLMRHILKALENPLKVMRRDNSISARLRKTSSRRSWSATFFGSWRQSLSESATGLGHVNREGISGGIKQSGRVGSHDSDRHEQSYSNKKLSSEIFPEPIEMQDIERQDEH